MIQAYADFMYQTALVDESQRDYFANKTQQALNFINQKKWLEAAEVYTSFIIHSCISNWHIKVCEGVNSMQCRGVSLLCESFALFCVIMWHIIKCTSQCCKYTVVTDTLHNASIGY